LGASWQIVGVYEIACRLDQEHLIKEDGIQLQAFTGEPLLKLEE